MNTFSQIIEENGFFPNNAKLPLFIYKNAFDSPKLNAHYIENTFLQNGWTNFWRDSVYDFHHYHSNTHEVLGVYSGSCEIQIGGENGKIFHLEKGDVLILPAGVSHKNSGCTADFACVGAYPFDISYDMNYGNADEKTAALANIQKTPLPKTDPVFGKKGPLFEAWKIKTLQ